MEQILLLWAVTVLQSHPHQQLRLHHLHPLFLCVCCHKTLETVPVVVYLGQQLGQEVCRPIHINNVKEWSIHQAWLVRPNIKCNVMPHQSRIGVGKLSSGWIGMISWQGPQLSKSWSQGVLNKQYKDFPFVFFFYTHTTNYYDYYYEYESIK